MKNKKLEKITYTLLMAFCIYFTVVNTICAFVNKDRSEMAVLLNLPRSLVWDFNMEV